LVFKINLQQIYILKYVIKRIFRRLKDEGIYYLLRNPLNKLELLFISTFKNKAEIHQDTIKNYGTYLLLQKKYGSHEINKIRWRLAQQRYIKKKFINFDKTLKIIDIACGDGVGLRQFKKMGFTNVYGVEFNEKKAFIAGKTKYKIFLNDMHDLTFIKNNEFDIIYSSHTLEHAYNPLKLVEEFYRILKPNGWLFVILPYPDIKSDNSIHVGKFKLGINILDDGKTLIKFFLNKNFVLNAKEYDNFRQPEIWLTFKKK